jgi:hypothetical protein
MIRATGERSDTNADAASAIAIEALSWLAGEPDRLQRFLAISGLGPHNLREAARNPGFLGAVLDYFAGNETLLVAFADESGRQPQEVAAAHARLGGPSAAPS